MKRRKIKLSASAISCFKACPMRYKGAYVEGIRRIEDTEAQRTGTNWHEIQDVSTLKPESVCKPCANLGKPDPHCPLCVGEGFLSDDLMNAVLRVLDVAYENIPAGVDTEVLERERTVLLYSLSGYKWNYSDAPIEVLARELKFSMPLLGSSGRALPNVCVDGMIDKLVRYNGKLAIMEHKSTSKSVDSDSSFWAHLNLDVQTTLYIHAVQKMQLEGELEAYGVKPTDELINTILYDAWHKPGISPKKLTQADSKKFVETGEYMGQEFDIEYKIPAWTAQEGVENPEKVAYYTVNGVPADIEPGKKEGTFAIRETTEMFGARLLVDITERPEFYFARKELSKTDDEMERFQSEILSIYRTIRGMLKTDNFYHNEQSCEAKFRCDYTNECYNGIELDGENPPDGFHCIFKGKE